MKAAIGRKLAGNVMKTWTEDFVDEDTGEVVSIERNKVVVERETIITEETVEQILDSAVSSILLHKDEEGANKYSIIFNTLAKDPSHSEIEAVIISIVSCVMLMLLMMQVHVKCSRTFSSLTSVMTWER